MASVNKAILVGNLGKDPEMRYTQSNTPVCSFSIATTNSWTDQQGNKQEKTEWHNIIAWARLAEVCNQYLKKGKQVYIEGEIQTRKWQDNNGHDRWTTEIKARVMQMLGTRADNQDGGQQAQPQGDPGPQGGQEPYYPQAPQTVPEDDELPFR